MNRLDAGVMMAMATGRALDKSGQFKWEGWFCGGIGC